MQKNREKADLGSTKGLGGEGPGTDWVGARSLQMSLQQYSNASLAPLLTGTQAAAQWDRAWVPS